MNYSLAEDSVTGRVIAAEQPELLRVVKVSEPAEGRAAVRAGVLASLLRAERRAAQEAEELRAIESSLSPRILPQLATLAYTGVSKEARQVGGDFYDFFPRGEGRLGIVIGDVSGKGVAAALLRTNLQATLRTLFSLVEDLEGALNLLNRSFQQSTPAGKYATLFCAEYNDVTGVLRYVNCGHPAPLFLRADGSLLRLDATCSVLGLFEDWRSAAAEIRLMPGDTLLLYTDGIVEASSRAGEEFGDDRLAELLRNGNDRGTSGLLNTIVEAVGQFSDGRQEDDMTLVGMLCGMFPAICRFPGLPTSYC